jgi:geranylgeranyl diphosphate synthase type II
MSATVAPSAGATSIFSHLGPIAAFLPRIDEAIDRAVGDGSPLSILEPARHILRAGGKRIRPVMTLAAAGAAGGNPENALSAAAAIEILHTFTLVHDDIMDNAPTRRGVETIHERWDASTAILAGDALAAFAYRSLTNGPLDRIGELVRELTEAFVVVCEGQAEDVELGTREAVRPSDYRAMIDHKTASVFGAAAALGAIVASADAARWNALRTFGTMFGRGFQIQDDLLDITADEAALGKRIGGDVIEGKRTFLVTIADERAAAPADRALLAEFRARHGLPADRIGEMRDLYERLGALDEARAETDLAIGAALGALGQLPPSPFLETLREIALAVQRRSY